MHALLLAIIVGIPHLTTIAYVNSMSACSCDLDARDAFVGFDARLIANERHVTMADRKALVDGFKADCAAACAPLWPTP